MERKIIILGCGPGASDLLTVKGQKVLENANVLVGSKRLINDFNRNNAALVIPLENNYEEIFNKVDHLKGDQSIVFLVSGDPLFCSFGALVINRFGKERCEIIPGVSSFQYAFCMLKESWKDYKLFSLHGHSRVDILAVFQENNNFALLLDPEHNLKFIKKRLMGAPEPDFDFFLCSNLSLEEEKVMEISFEDFDKVQQESLSILIGKKKGDKAL